MGDRAWPTTGGKEWFQVLAENSPYGIAVIRRSGEFSYVNPRFVEVFGYNLGDVPDGKTWFRKAYPDEKYRHVAVDAWCEDLKVMGPGTQRPRVFAVSCKDGTTKTIRFVPVALATGENLLTCEDITERVRYEERLTYEAQLLEHVHDAIFSTDENLIFRSWNRAAERMYGWKEEEVLGKQVREVIRSRFVEMEREEAVRILAAHGKFRGEIVQTRRDGSEVYVESTGIAVRNNEGELTGYVFVNRDMTERQKAEERLKTMEELESSVLGAIPHAVVGLREREIIFANNAVEMVFGWKPEEVIGHQTRIFYLSDEEYEEIGSHFYPVLAKQRVHREEWPCRRKDGTEIVCRVNTCRIGEDLTEKRIVAVYEDITEQKKAEATIRESEEKYRSIYENAVEGIYQSTRDGKFLTVNPTLARIFGYTSPDEMIDSIQNIDEDFYVDSSRRAELKRELEEKGIAQGFESEVYHKDGSRVWVSVNARSVKDEEGNVLYYEGFLENITDQKRALETMRENEGKYRTLVESLPAGVTIIQGGRVVFVNTAALIMFGYDSMESILGQDAMTPVVESERERLLGYLRTRLDGGEGIPEQYETVFKRRDGENFPAEVFVKPITYQGSPAQQVVVMDISARKRTEGALTLQAQMLDQIHDAVIATDMNGFVTAWNRAAEELYEYTKEEAMGRHVSFIYPEEQFRYREKEMVPQVREAGNFDGEIKMRKRSGKVFHVHMLLSALRNEKGELVGVIGYHIDITKNKELEEQLRQAQKMEAVGQLAGGIAHDFNNIISVIMGSASLLRLKMEKDDPLMNHVNQVSFAAERAANLTQSLLAFSRKQIVNLRLVNLNDIVNNSKKLLLRVITEDIELETILSKERLPIMADEVHMGQILMNLAANARDAMVHGGRLTITTEVATGNEEMTSAGGLSVPVRYACLSVTDTGVGMTQEVRDRIFDPFFTTKEIGRGTGLGLSIVYGIVKQHNGYITVSSEPGKGTTFRIRFSITPGTGESVEKVEPIMPRRGNEIILIAEDDPAVRSLIKETLEHYGYKVLEAVDGEDAVRVYREHKDTIDLVILDVVMPRKNGKEAHDAIKRIEPGAKALFVSGYTAEIIHQKGILEKDLHFVTKPVTTEVLLAKVREILDG
jgi:two-component system cell cycle sensor histidine kinase/response regulator CckA